MGARTSSLLGVLVQACVCLIAPSTQSRADVAQEIREEAMLPDDGPAGRPLPLASHWNPGLVTGGFDPDYQMRLIRGGHHLLPWFFFPAPGDARAQPGYYEAAIREAARQRLPISLVGTQWERLLVDGPAYFGRSVRDNPNVMVVEGKPPKLSPFGPLEPWREAARAWMSTLAIARMQQWYPDPPLVLFVSNNEQEKLAATEVEQSPEYLRLHGGGRSDEFKRRVVGDAWIGRYRTLQAGMRANLAAPAWREHARFVGYNAFLSPLIGRYPGWMSGSLYVPGRLQPWPLAWDGASVSFYVRPYDDSTDFMFWSPQVESMNWVFMLDEARRANRGFWFEISTWDGDDAQRQEYAKLGQSVGPQRYGGMVKFGMWLLRPRVVREFRLHHDTLRDAEAYFLSIADAVDEVHANEVLRRFWRHGELVSNPERRHPYDQNIPTEYADAQRWFLLSTSLDPAWPWHFGTQIPVFSLARMLGDAPRREWLVFVHAPAGARRGVEVLLPGYRGIRVDATPAGNYFHVVESAGTVSPVMPGVVPRSPENLRP